MNQKQIKGEALAHKEYELAQYTGEDRIVSSHDLAKELEKTKDAIVTVSTGIETLDRLLGDGGVEVGELIVVTGPTGEGKTTLLMSITANMAKNDARAVWFTLEVTPRQFLKKMVVAGSELPLFYLPNENTNNTIEWLEDRIIEAKVKFNTNVVFIDHIHQIFSLHRVKNQNNISLEIGDMVGKIKDIAIRHNMVIYLIAHSKDPATPTAEPRKEDIRDSGLISRLADTIIGVWRIPNSYDGTETHRRKPIEEDDNKTKVRVFKNRREGRLGTFVMYHNHHYLTEDAFAGFDE